MKTLDQPVPDPSWTDEPHLMWAVWVRWLVIGGFLALALAAHRWGLFPRIGLCAVAGVAGAVLNGANAWCLRRGRAVVAMTALAIPLDHVLITAVIAGTGGIQSPFVMMYPVQVATTALLISVGAGVSSVLLAAICVALLQASTALGWVEPAALVASDVSSSDGRVALAWVVFLVYCLCLLALVAGYVSASMRRGERALAASTRSLERTVQSLRSARDELAVAYERLKQAESHLVHSEKMHALGQLVAGVAHELNNPLSFVIANLGHVRSSWGRFEKLLAETRDLVAPTDLREPYERCRAAIGIETLCAEMPELLGDVEEGARRAVQIVGELRTFSRPEGPEGWSAVDVNAGLRTTAKLLRHRMGVGIDLHLDLVTVPPVRGLAGALNQVFLNLLANAVDAVGARGRVWVSTRPDAAGSVVVRISDDGCGIAPEHLRRVFDPFFTTKPVGSGTGLGLSISYAIVQRHGGRIEVVSQPGCGTTFEIWLPSGAEKVYHPREEC